jgi:hypothetical protein
MGTEDGIEARVRTEIGCCECFKAVELEVNAEWMAGEEVVLAGHMRWKRWLVLGLVGYLESYSVY